MLEPIVTPSAGMVFLKIQSIAEQNKAGASMQLDVRRKISRMSGKRHNWLSERMMVYPREDPLSGAVGRVVCPGVSKPSAEPHGRPSLDVDVGYKLPMILRE